LIRLWYVSKDSWRDSRVKDGEGWIRSRAVQKDKDLINWIQLSHTARQLLHDRRQDATKSSSPGEDGMSSVSEARVLYRKRQWISVDTMLRHDRTCYMLLQNHIDTVVHLCAFVVLYPSKLEFFLQAPQAAPAATSVSGAAGLPSSVVGRPMRCPRETGDDGPDSCIGCMMLHGEDCLLIVFRTKLMRCLVDTAASKCTGHLTVPKRIQQPQRFFRM
jgi:hypothetical protein